MRLGLWKAVVVLGVLAGVGCSANMDVKKKQAEDLRGLASQYMRQGDYTSALRNLIEAEKIYGKDPELHNDLGLAYMEKGEIERAVAHFKQALDLKPDYAYARNNMGTAYLRAQRWDDAIATLEPLLKDLLYDTPYRAKSNLGLAYYSKKDFPKAQQYYQQALDQLPAFVPALHGLGLTYLDSGQTASAVTMMEKAVKQAPRVAVLHFDLARALERSGKTAQARDAYAKVLELENKEGQLAAKAAEALAKLR